MRVHVLVSMGGTLALALGLCSVESLDEAKVTGDLTCSSVMVSLQSADSLAKCQSSVQKL